MKKTATIKLPKHYPKKPVSSFQLIFPLVIASLLLYYVYQLEKLANCPCSDDWRREYIKYYFGFIIVFVLVSLITGFRLARTGVFNIIVTLLGLVQIYALFTYTQRLQKECNCATELDLYKFAKYYSWFQIIVLALGLVFTILFALLISRTRV